MEHIKEMIENGKKQVRDLEKEGKYTAEHINKVKQDITNQISEAYKEVYQNNIYKLEGMKNDVIRKYDPAAVVYDPQRPETKYNMGPEKRYKKLLEQSPELYKLQIEMDERRGIYSYDINGTPIVDGAVVDDAGKVKTRQEVDLEVNQKLLENRRMETEIKAARTADLEAELEKLNTNKAGDIDRINLVAAELRNRGKHDVADQLLDYTEAYNVKEPWKNDPDFIAADKKIKEQEVYSKVDDMLFIDEEGDRHISIKDIFEVDEEAEAEKRLKAEMAEYEEAAKRGKD